MQATATTAALVEYRLQIFLQDEPKARARVNKLFIDEIVIVIYTIRFTKL
jgi:hypothetical protein